MASPDLSIPICTCSRCGHKWYLRKPENPRFCPKCKSQYWNSGESEPRQRLNIDIADARQIEEMLSQTLEEAERNQLRWREIAGIGWERMFRTSDFPVSNLQVILDAGFSICDWFMITPELSKVLAVEIQNKLENSRLMNRDGDPVLERAKKVLDWNQVLSGIESETIKVLGFLWYADLQGTKLQFTETQALIQCKAWKQLETKFSKTEEELRAQTQLMIDNLDENNVGVISWVEVMRFP